VNPVVVLPAKRQEGRFVSYCTYNTSYPGKLTHSCLKKQPRSAGAGDGRRLPELGVHFDFKGEELLAAKCVLDVSPRSDLIGRDCADDQHSLRCRICLLMGLQYTDGSCQSEVAKSFDQMNECRAPSCMLLKVRLCAGSAIRLRLWQTCCPGMGATTLSPSLIVGPIMSIWPLQRM